MQNLQADNILIREVWRNNLEYEIGLISGIVDRYPFVAIDTEYPGHVIQPAWPHPNYNYQKLKDNVNVLKLVQLGLTFFDEHGNLPTFETDKYYIWQINFCEFNPNEDICANESVRLLINSGIDFMKNNENGVNVVMFSQLLLTSGVVLNDDVHFITFHGLYDIGFLVKLLQGKDLPNTESEFLRLVKTFFPKLYDIKHLIRHINGIYGGLQTVANLLNVQRIVGTAHQAGSDSLLTCCIFLKLIKDHFEGSLPNDGNEGVLYDLGQYYRNRNRQ